MVIIKRLKHLLFPANAACANYAGLRPQSTSANLISYCLLQANERKNNNNRETNDEDINKVE